MGTVLQRNRDTENYRINLTTTTTLTMLAAVLLSLVASAAAGGGFSPMAMARQVEAGNIVEELQRNGASTLVELAVKAGLADTLTGPGPFTIFAPTNAAFAALPADLVAAVTADTELLKSVLLYHAVAGEVTSDMASNDIKLDSVEGNPLLVNVYTKNYHHGAASTITVNGKKVIKADVKATNGVIHFIDGVMLIPKGDLVAVLAGDERVSTLVTAVTEAGLVDTVSWGNVATAGGEEICTAVFRGGRVKVSSHSGGNKASAMVVEADLAATNGVVHAIDTVI